MFRQWLARQWLALSVGVGITLTVMLAHWGGLTDRLEWLAFDVYVRHFSRVPASDRILHIDIDDQAIDRVASWPWPRDFQAGLIRILKELGAEQIIMDIVWSDPKAAEWRTPGLNPYAELEGKIEQAGELSQENMVFGDDELAEAISRAGNVYLAYYYEDAQSYHFPSDARPGLTDRMADLLRTDFSLDTAQLAQRIGQPPEQVEAVVAGVKQQVARERVARVLAKQPELLQQTPEVITRAVHGAILDTPFERVTADRKEIIVALHRELGIRYLRQRCPMVPEALRGRLPVIPDISPPVYKLTIPGTEANPRFVRAGFVNFRDDRDGILRHIPLLAEWKGRLVEQLAFAAMRDLLDIRLEDLAIDSAGQLVIQGRADRRTMTIQLDEHGQILVNWHARPDKWQHCFDHLPVAKLLQLHDADRQIEENQRLRDIRLGEAMSLAMEPDTFAGYRERVNRMLELRRLVERSARVAHVGADIASVRNEVEELRLSVERDHADAMAFINQMWQELEKEPDPNDPEIAEDYRRFKEAHRLVAEEAPGLEEINSNIAAERARIAEQLRPLVARKLCFVGYAATAVADMVTAPPHGRMPGVLIHSQVANSLLQGQFRSWSGMGTQLTVIALFGLAVTLVTTTGGPKATSALMVLIIVLAMAINASGLFERLDHWLQLVSAMVLAFVVWALIVMVRYLVTDRQRRQFSRAVAQYVSPAMARRIGESAQNLDLAPANAVVSCFFSDLAGFTSLSEALGPDGTRAVLNPYLQSMSQVLHRHNALINKFMGDGIFAFFNPPILICPQHEIAACEAALDCQQALQDLIAFHAKDPMAAAFSRLAMRIGIASGSAFVGDYGSESKLDYTCVGDIVNLAARLESANKQFGTFLMVAGSTREAAGNRFLYRHLGALQVKGQSVGIPVYELLGRPGQVNGDNLSYAETFGAAVQAFSCRDWLQALAGFERCLELRSNDQACLRYVSAIREYKQKPPPAEWLGVIELTEK